MRDIDRFPALLERLYELDALGDVLVRARAGDGALVLLEGAAGIGKSALLDAAEVLAERDGFGVLRVRGDELVMGSSFAAVRELFWREVRSAGAGLFDGASRLAMRVFEDERQDDGVDRDRASSVLHGLYWLTADLADRRPLVLLIDDAQWLDAASARFLLYLAARVGGLSVAIVVVVRSGERSEAADLATALTQHAGVVLRPGPLSEGSSGELLRAVLGARADEDLCLLCHNASQGNPFYLRELALALAAEGGRPTVELATRVRALRISAITANVLVRLARLGSDCERLCEALAVLGPESSLRHLAKLADLESESARLAADRLYEAELVASGPGLTFVHPIVNEAIASELPPARRAALHGRAARLLAQEDGSAGRVGAHLLLAEPEGDGWVVDRLRGLAREALSRGAPESAVAFLNRARREPPFVEVTVPLLVELGRSEALLPTAQDFSALREALVRVPAGPERAEIAYELALALFGVWRNREAVAVLADAIGSHGDLDTDTADRLEAAMIGGGIGDLQESPRLLSRAERHFELARRGQIDDPLMLSSLAQTAAACGSSANEAASLARSSLADGRLLTRWLNAGYMGAVIGLSFSDHSHEALAVIREGMLAAQECGSAPMLFQFNFFGADAALRLGDLDLAEDFAERAFELGCELGAEQPARMWLPMVLRERGRLEDAASMLESIAVGDPADLLEAGLLAHRGRVRVDLGDYEAGLADLLEADRRTAAAQVQLFVDWVPSAALALSRLGRINEARGLAERELGRAVRFAAPRRRGIALATCAQHDPGDAGFARLLESVALLDGCGARLAHSRALTDLGVRQQKLGDRDGARSSLAEAFEIADACGGWAQAELARTELIAAGARPRRAARTGPESLTPAEMRAASLAAQGLTNRQIAQSLFLSTKTVETQLSHAYAKLSVSSRTDLAPALARHRSTRADPTRLM